MEREQNSPARVVKRSLVCLIGTQKKNPSADQHQLVSDSFPEKRLWDICTSDALSVKNER